MTFTDSLTAPWLHWTAPAALALGALLAAALRHSYWRVLAAATRVALGLSAATLVALWIQRSQPDATQLYVSGLTGLLVSFLGWVIGGYSRQYLQGEPGQRRFAVAYLATLAAVASLVASANLAVILLAWIAVSVGLHQLLTYYPDRRAAVVAAHKKFIASRAAELCLALAVALLYLEWGTLEVDALNRHAAGPLPTLAVIATALIALAALLKCAQMPLHGWLIQVMEAPTPVSALLHAGVVNLGGYLLIRLAPLIDASLTARALLVLVGSLTAVGAGLVMMTRVTIKVRLAWSTCSQMGFMLMEIGLGLYDLALLHLLAHSLYKAGAFLSAGEVMRESLWLDHARAALRPSDNMTFWPTMLAPALAWLTIAALSESWHLLGGMPRIPWPGAVLLSLGIATLLWQVRCSPVLLAGAMACVAQLYLLWHWTLSAALKFPAHPAPLALGLWVTALFVLLYLAQGLVLMRRLPADSRWYQRAYAGFYLDERFTRLAFTLWPTPARPAPRIRPDVAERAS